jgi:hypothetical protein
VIHIRWIDSKLYVRPIADRSSVDLGGPGDVRSALGGGGIVGDARGP